MSRPGRAGARGVAGPDGVRRQFDTIRGSRWCRATVRWLDQHADDVVYVVVRFAFGALAWCVVMTCAIGYVPVVADHVVDFIVAVAGGQQTRDAAVSGLVGIGLMVTMAVSAFVIARWVARRVRRRWAQSRYPTAVAAAPVMLPEAYRSFEGQYRHDFVAVVAAELGPHPQVADLQGALEERFEWWRWGTSGPVPREVAVHEAVHAVVVHALGGVVRRIEMFASGDAGATLYPLPPRGAGQADTSMFRVCVEVGPHVWLTRTPGWDGTNHGLPLPTPWAGRHADSSCGCSSDLDHVTATVTGMRVAALEPSVWPGETVPVDGTGRPDLLAWATARVTSLLEVNADVVDELAAFLLEALTEHRTVWGWELHDILRRVQPPQGVLLGVDRGSREPVIAGGPR